MHTFRLFFRALPFAAAAAVLAGCGSQVHTAASPLTIGPASLADGTMSSPYNATLSVTGGTTPYTCQLSGGAVPAGLALASNCEISGVPTAIGSATFSVTAYDSSSPVRAGSASLSIRVEPTAVVLTSSSLPVGFVGTAYSASIGVSGGTSPYTCTLASGTMPAGLTLNPNCSVTGTPSILGSLSFGVKVTDSTSPAQTATGTVNVTIVAPGAPGRVQAGNLPVIGASVQIYAAGTTGNGSAPKALLSAPFVTDNAGAFMADPTKFTCPSPGTLVYLVATGGHAGANPANNGTVLMSSPGACSKLASSTVLILNELTTAASAYAFAQFMAPGAQIGATSTNTLGLSLAAGTLANLVDTSAGTTPGASFPSATGVAPSAKLALLARLMNACITGSASAACSTLYNLATPGTAAQPANTLDAVLNLVKNPSLNVAALYTYAQSLPGTVYPSIPSTQPSDWTLFVTYTGGGLSDPASLSIDSNGRIWVANYYNSNGVASLFNNTGTAIFAGGVGDSSIMNTYGAAVDANDNFWIANEEGGPSNLGTVTVFNSAGSKALNSPFTQGGLNFPISVAFETNGTAWIVDYGNSHMTLLDKNGNPLSGAAGYSSSQLVFPVAVAVDNKHNGWIANQSSNTVTRLSADGTSFTSYIVGSGPSGVAVDANNNVWTANYYGDSLGMVSSSGTVLSGSSGIQGGGVVHPQGIAIDGANRAWIANYRGASLSEYSAISGSTPGAALSPAAGWAPDAQLLEAFGIAIDSAGNIWLSNFGSNTLTEFVGLAAPVKTPLIGTPTAP